MSRLPYRGYFRSIWDYFTKVRPAKKRSKDEIVGMDLSGNQYVQRHGDPRAGIKHTRIVLPSEESAAMYTIKPNMNVPQEWDEWLRFRRDDPPTLEELEMNNLKRLKMQHRVREIERKEMLEKGEDVREIGTDLKTDALTATLTQDISGDTTKSSFPQYDDLEKWAGENQRPPKH